MVTRSNAPWMTRTKGIYQFSLSPMAQRAFAGWVHETKNIFKLHWRGSLAVTSMALGTYGLVVWANYSHHQRERKNHAHYTEEWENIKPHDLIEATLTE